MRLLVRWEDRPLGYTFCSLAAPVLLEPMCEGHEQLLAAALSSRPLRA